LRCLPKGPPAGEKRNEVSSPAPALALVKAARARATIAARSGGLDNVEVAYLSASENHRPARAGARVHLGITGEDLCGAR